ncbi:MAG: hypothetical protein KF718_04155 [Polyangiaceae bacterium]|nr:hypothetical protein [Polyangiaceae bacterium]
MPCFRHLLGLWLALAVASSSAWAEPKRSAKDELRERRAARPEAHPNTCATCHASLPEAKLRLPAVQYEKSVHKDPRIGCVGCHKGDPEDPTVRAHAAEGFIPRPPHDAVSAICGGCHSDARFIREFNPRLQVDQATLYHLSLHSKLSAAGDRNAPNCADCHGAHDVSRVDALTAPVHPKNVVELCGKCHSDRERMKPYETTTDQVLRWQRSLHAEVFATDQAAAPTCTGCHGAHAGAAAAGSTTHVCGACHEEQLKYVRQSPHAKPFEQLGLSECTPCHDKHEALATRWLVGMAADSACGKCHSLDEKVHTAADEIATLLSGVRERSEAARESLQDARRAGLLIRGAGPILDELRTQELKLRTVVHTVDKNQIRVVARAADEASLQAMRLADQARTDRRVERRGYYFALGLSLLLLLLLAAKAVQLERRRRREA